MYTNTHAALGRALTNCVALFALRLASPAVKYHEVCGPWGKPRRSEKDRLKVMYVSEGINLNFGKLKDINQCENL